MKRSETGEVYKGVPIQNHQPRERIERRVKPQIDHVLALTDVSALIEYARDISCPPEARLLAAAKLEAIFSLAATDRRVRPDVELAKVRAIVAGLEEGSIWRSPWSYGCICDGSISHDGAQPEMREHPLDDIELRG